MKAKAFDRIIGIDYSGSNRPTRRISGLAVCSADVDAPPHIVCGPKEGSQNWTRKEIAKWLVEQLREENKPTLVSIDHAFSFPIDYFKEYGLPEGDWARFLTDFREYWPTHEDDKQVKDILKAQRGRKRCDTAGRKYHRLGDPKWTRLTDDLVPGAKGVFDFKIKQGQVATSTHAGLPWLLYLRRKLEKSGPKVHFWPFDGWKFDEGVSVVAEVYPALWKGQVGPRMAGTRMAGTRMAGMSPDQYDAYIVATWLSWADRNGLLGRYFEPELFPTQCKTAKTEGWILGVLDFNRLGVGEGVKAVLHQ